MKNATSQRPTNGNQFHTTNIYNRIGATLLILYFVALLGCGAGGGNSQNSGAKATNWQFTAFGDSTTSGSGASAPQFNYVNRFSENITADTGSIIFVSNQGRTGWTSTELSKALTDSTNPDFSDFRSRITNSQVITVFIGLNDLGRARSNYKLQNCGGADNQLCLQQAVDTFKTNFNTILSEILTLRTANNTIIRIIDVYNPSVAADKVADTWANDGGLNDFQALKPYFDDLNAFLSSAAAAKGIPVAKVYLRFNGVNGDTDASSLIADSQHPNDQGHQAIADELRLLKYAPLK